MRRCLVLLFISGLITLQGYGSIVSIPLDCAGDYVDGAEWTTELSLYQQFSEINSISIQWSGEIGPEILINLNPPYSLWYVPATFAAEINTLAYIPIATAHSDISATSNSLPFSGTDSFGFWNNWEQYLLEGPVSLRIRPVKAVGHAQIWGMYDRADGVIDSATLIVDGTLVPEPATMCLLGLGLLGLRRKNRV